VVRDIKRFYCKFLGEYNDERIFENRSMYARVIHECRVAYFLLSHSVFMSYILTYIENRPRITTTDKQFENLVFLKSINWIIVAFME